MNRKQQVYLGKTLQGKAGLFTNGYMAVPVDADEYERFFGDYAACAAFATRLGFELIDLRSQELVLTKTGFTAKGAL
jgi:hypothetical protein